MVHGKASLSYGLSDEQWQTAQSEIRKKMITVAQLETTITYGDLAAQLTSVVFHPGAYAFHALLREICYEEDDAGRGMLCAVVVSKAHGIPGQGFFKAIAKRGRDCSDPLQCWQAECTFVYEVWGNTN